MSEVNQTTGNENLNAGANANAEGGTSNTDTSLNGEYRAGAGIYVNAQGEWTDPNGTVLRGQALMSAEANASAKYGVGYRDGNLYVEAVAEAKLRAEVALKAEIENAIDSCESVKGQNWDKGTNMCIKITTTETPIPKGDPEPQPEPEIFNGNLQLCGSNQSITECIADLQAPSLLDDNVIIIIVIAITILIVIAIISKRQNRSYGLMNRY